MQGGTYDCGVFAIAFATSIAHGIDPVKSYYDQKKMRRHLYDCLTAGKLTPFPTLRKGPTSKRAMVYYEIKVHCHCRMPELKDVEMVECSLCSKWVHVMCDSVKKECINSDIKWFCQNCT